MSSGETKYLTGFRPAPKGDVVVDRMPELEDLAVDNAAVISPIALRPEHDLGWPGWAPLLRAGQTPLQPPAAPGGTANARICRTART